MCPSPPSPAPVLDSHQHFWRYSPNDYGWIPPDSALCHDFSPADLAPLLADAKIDGCIAVQARETTEETDWLLSLSDKNPWIRAVVGWAPLWEPDGILLPLLERWTAPAHNRHLRGIRVVAQNQPKGFLLGKAFGRGLGHLTAFDLTFDLLIGAHQIAEAAVLVDQHPEQQFVVDHCAKPRLRDQAMEPWATHLREIARRPQVACKVSGLVTEANPTRWTDDDVRPYWNVVREAFGFDRLLFGSDWPVCLLASSYGRWADTVRGWSAALSPTEQAALWGGTAARVYGIQAPTPFPSPAARERGV